MGREKEYRQRLNYQVASTQKKTLTNQIQTELESNLGLAPAESELLSERIHSWFCAQDKLRDPNQIYVAGAKDREAFARRVTRNNSKQVVITPFHHEDLELEVEFGLKAMQLGRCLRMIQEAYQQDSLLSARTLTLVLNITPTSLRSRLNKVRELGIWAPIRGLSTGKRKGNFLFRSSWIIKRYLTDLDLHRARKQAGLTENRFQKILERFARVITDYQNGELHPTAPEEKQWLELEVPEEKLNELKWYYSPKKVTSCDLKEELKEEFGFSPVKIRAVCAFLSELRAKIADCRGKWEVIYWAVSSTEPAGKPLSECKLVPATINLLHEDDLQAADATLNRLKEFKLRKVLRYATETKQDGGYLTYADLSYLLGVNTNSLSALVKDSPQLAVPLRGSECDIGRGTTHRKEIIELYLQMYTETDIVTRTGHSYEAIENYIKEFAAVWVLSKRGLPAAMIRKITGRSSKLIRAYLELIEEYAAAEYAFRFQQLERIFGQHEPEFKKRGPLKW